VPAPTSSHALLANSEFQRLTQAPPATVGSSEITNPEEFRLVSRAHILAWREDLEHGLRREEVCSLTVSSIHQHRGVPHPPVHGEGGKVRHIPLHPGSHKLLLDYLEASGHAQDKEGALSARPATGTIDRPLSPDGVHKIMRGDSPELGAPSGPHAARETAATNALDNGADIAKVQKWLGHADISTTRIYDRRKSRPEDSPTFKVSYGQLSVAAEKARSVPGAGSESTQLAYQRSSIVDLVL
jgi:integrase